MGEENLGQGEQLAWTPWVELCLLFEEHQRSTCGWGGGGRERRKQGRRGCGEPAAGHGSEGLNGEKRSDVIWCTFQKHHSGCCLGNRQRQREQRLKQRGHLDTTAVMQVETMVAELERERGLDSGNTLKVEPVGFPICILSRGCGRKGRLQDDCSGFIEQLGGWSCLLRRSLFGGAA